jgi:hypothetical protein
MKDYKIFEKYKAKIFNTSNIHNINKLITEIEYHTNIPSSRLTDNDYQLMSKIEIIDLLTKDNTKIFLFLVYKKQYIKVLDSSNFSVGELSRIINQKFDYCIVLNLKTLFTTHKTQKDIQKQRKENFPKSSDNIQRYVDLLLNKFDYSTKDASLLSTKKLFKLITPLSVYKIGHTYLQSHLGDYSRHYRRLLHYIEKNNANDIESELLEVRKYIGAIYKDNLRYTKNSANIVNILKNEPDLLEMWDKVKKYDDIFIEHYNNLEIKTVDDFTSEISKIREIQEFLNYTTAGSRLNNVSGYFMQMATANKLHIKDYIYNLNQRKDLNIEESMKEISLKLA